MHYLCYRLGSFMGIANSFDQYPRDWYQWYTSSEPENTPLPGEVFTVNAPVTRYTQYYRGMAELV